MTVKISRTGEVQKFFEEAAGFAGGLTHRVGFFAGLPAPTGISQALRAAQYLWERACPRKGRPCQYITIRQKPLAKPTKPSTLQCVPPPNRV